MSSDLLPHQVVLDQVLLYSTLMPKLGQAAVLSGNLIIATRNHLGQYVSISAPVNFDGEPITGASPRFVLYQIGATVWKLAPSINHPLLHTYLTIADVPEDVGWK